MTSVKIMLDPDGAGGVSPFPVKCVWNKTAGTVSTVVHHNRETRTRVLGYENRGSYSAIITYEEASTAQVFALVSVATNCKQFVKYECHHSGLSSGYWKDRFGQIMTVWSSGKLTTSSSTLCQSGKACECAEK